MSVKNLFYWNYWFSQPYIARGKTFMAGLLFFLLLVLVGMVASYTKHYQTTESGKKFWGSLSNFGLGLGLTALVWFWFRQMRVVFLAWRFWLLIWLAVFIIWVIKLVWYATKRMPKIKEEHSQKSAKAKYLP